MRRWGRAKHQVSFLSQRGSEHAHIYGSNCLVRLYAAPWRLQILPLVYTRSSLYSFLPSCLANNRFFRCCCLFLLLFSFSFSFTYLNKYNFQRDVPRCSFSIDHFGFLYRLWYHRSGTRITRLAYALFKITAPAWAPSYWLNPCKESEPSLNTWRSQSPCPSRPTDWSPVRKANPF